MSGAEAFAGRTLDAALRLLRDRLAPVAGEGARAEARMLAGRTLGLDLTGLVREGDRLVDAATAEVFAGAVARRLGGEPMQRIVGVASFFGLDFALAPATLIPRPDTETLVETVLAALAETATVTGVGRAPVIADLGVGSGAILVALLDALPQARGVGSDLSQEALAVARANADRAGVGTRALLVRGSYASMLAAGRFDAIVSNPPYIASAEIETLDGEVRLHEPRLALDGGADGLDAYRAIVAQAPSRLVAGGLLAVEIGWRQGPEVAALFAAAGFDGVRIVADLAGRDRVVLGRRAGGGGEAVVGDAK